MGAPTSFAWGGKGASTFPGLEEVADGEFEDARLLVRERLEREAPFEAERGEGREPADAEAPRGAHVEEAARREAGVRRRVGRGRRGLAVERLEVPRVAEIGEDHAADL